MVRMERTTALLALLVLVFMATGAMADGSPIANDPAAGAAARAAGHPGNAGPDTPIQELAQTERAPRRPFAIRAAVGFNPGTAAKSSFNLSISGARTMVNVWVTNQTDKPQVTDISVGVKGSESDGYDRLVRSQTIAPDETVRETFVMRLSGEREVQLNVAADVAGAPLHEYIIEPVTLLTEGNPDSKLTVVVGGSAGGHKALRNRSAAPILNCPADLLPDDSCAYEGIQTVILHDVATLSGLTDTAVKALEGFVIHGGHLVVENAKGISADAPLARTIQPLLPVSLKFATLTFAGLEIVPAPAGAGAGAVPDPDLLKHPPLLCAAPLAPASQTRLTLVRGLYHTPTPTAPLWAAAGVLGRGTVHYLGFCLDHQPPLDSSLIETLAVIRHELDDTSNLFSSRIPRRRSLGDQVKGDRALELAVRSEDFRRLPTHHAVLVFLLVYALLAGPGLRLLSRAARRPLAGWVALPVVVVIFTFLAPTLLSIRNHFPDTPGARRLTFLETSSRSPVAIAHSMVALFSPVHERYSMSVDAPGDAMHIDRFDSGLTNRALDETPTTCVYRNHTLWAENMTQSANSTTLHDVSGTLDIGGGIEFKYISSSGTADQRRDQVFIRNRSELSIRSANIMLGNRLLCIVETLRPGESRTLGVDPGTGKEPGFELGFRDDFFATNVRLFEFVWGVSIDITHDRVQPVMIARLAGSGGVDCHIYPTPGKNWPLTRANDGFVPQEASYLTVWGEGGDAGRLGQGIVPPMWKDAAAGAGEHGKESGR